MRRRLTRHMVSAYLQEIGIDYLLVPLRANAEPETETLPSGGEGETLEDLQAEVRACRRCALCSGRRNVVFGVGNPRARLLFVGEGPGEEEDRQGEPFVGAAGRRLTQWIERIGLTRRDVYIANIVKCRPPGNRAPLPEEAAACLPYLRRQIRSIRPAVICTLGAVALNFLLGNNDRITRARGTWRDWDGIPVLPTYHPAYILRNATREHEVLADFDLLAERLRSG
ncbi:MAG TPA: uracil-DNA glycosylase [Candidatus Deferrimicrobiaceae bacterium]|nr:uracil-DNA glycosylase [Candidatus Deferrimicrobiaceae bacterium]